MQKKVLEKKQKKARESSENFACEALKNVCPLPKWKITFLTPAQ